MTNKVFAVGLKSWQWLWLRSPILVLVWEAPCVSWATVDQWSHDWIDPSPRGNFEKAKKFAKSAKGQVSQKILKKINTVKYLQSFRWLQIVLMIKPLLVDDFWMDCSLATRSFNLISFQWFQTFDHYHMENLVFIKLLIHIPFNLPYFLYTYLLANQIAEITQCWDITNLHSDCTLHQSLGWWAWLWCQVFPTSLKITWTAIPCVPMQT